MSLDGREALYEGVDSEGVAIRRPMSPHLDVYRFRLSMALSIGNRIAGVASALGSVLAFGWLGALASGPKSFACARKAAGSLPGRLVFAGWGLATVYHIVAGVRHITWDDGHRFEKAEINEDGRISLFVAGGVTAFLVGAATILGGIRRKGGKA
jgi:succinate dehydrogenase / fumarate reductase cytochrome b subunit